ncbi:hypothetical protein [Nostoc sp.]|uniref:hypothetical protein n=1 Tax=Nostoc sp. TaxID=1180 RepID=UPI002FF8AA36
MTGIEPWAMSAVNGVAVPIFQSLCGSGGNILERFRKRLDEKTKDIIFSASNRYEKNYFLNGCCIYAVMY